MVVPLDTTTRVYCEVADVTTRVDLTDLPQLNLEYLVRAVSNRIERVTNRVFMRVPSTGTETRHFLGNGLALLPVDDLLSLSSLTVDGDSVDTDEVLCMPFGKTPTTWLEYEAGGTWTPRVDVAVIGAWGYSEEVPWEIWDAAVTLAVRALQMARTAYQDASAIPELGELVYSLALPANIRSTLLGLRRTVV